MDELTEVAGAVADPVRREILVMLRHAPLTAGEIAARFTISRPAISRHLRVLRESGLVEDEQVGRHRRYSLVRSRLGRLAVWLTQFDDRQSELDDRQSELADRQSDWTRRLAALETEVHRTRREGSRAEPGGTGRTAHHSEEDTA